MNAGLEFSARAFGLLAFILAAYLVVPPLRQLLRRLFAPYRATEPSVWLIERGLLLAVWIGIALVVITKIPGVAPFCGDAVAFVRPALLSLAELVDLLKFVAICACILIAGRYAAKR